MVQSCQVVANISIRQAAARIRVKRSMLNLLPRISAGLQEERNFAEACSASTQVKGLKKKTDLLATHEQRGNVASRIYTTPDGNHLSAQSNTGRRLRFDGPEDLCKVKLGCVR